MNSHKTNAAYYTVTLSSGNSTRLLFSNNERAFIVSQLQDILGVRSLLEEPNGHLRLASHIDLLAFSILPTSIHLVLFSISEKSVLTLSEILCKRLLEYRSEWLLNTQWHNLTKPTVIIKKLAGPYDALEATLRTHLRHLDWEFDRYSSVGFYLYDRRGDWMRIWRLVSLYENSSENYKQLLQNMPEFIKNTPEPALL